MAWDSPQCIHDLMSVVSGVDRIRNCTEIIFPWVCNIALPRSSSHCWWQGFLLSIEYFNFILEIIAGIEMELASRADQRVLRWFGHVERMDDYCMARRVFMAKVSGGRVRGRLRLSWMDGVKVALGN